MLEKEKGNNKFTFKKGNLTTLDEEDVDSSDNKPFFCLIALDDDVNKVYNSNLPCSSDKDEIDDLYNELYNSLFKFKKKLKNTLAKNKYYLERLRC